MNNFYAVTKTNIFFFFLETKSKFEAKENSEKDIKINIDNQ